MTVRLIALLIAATSGAATARPVVADAIALSGAAPYVAVLLNGAPARLRVAFDAPYPLILSPAAVARLALPARGEAVTSVGPVVLRGRSGAVRLAIGAAAATVPAMWNAVAPDPDDGDADGIVSPAALPVRGVRMALGGIGGRRHILPVHAPGAGVAVARLDGFGAPVELRLAPDRADTIASARAGALIAARLGGAVRRAVPPRRPILFGVARPVSLLALGRPLAIGGRSLDRLLVRTADYAGPVAPRAAPPPDADEVVVTGRAAASPARARLTLGADVLGGCAAVEWVARPPRLVLECP